MPISPTALTLKYLRENGWTACIVEKWNAFSHTRHDAFGFGDILACNGHGIALIQTTTHANRKARLSKIVGSPEAKIWLQSGGFIFLITWRKVGGRWREDLTRITESDLAIARINT